VFGEEWALTGHDDRLTRVLAEHLHLLGKDVDLAGLPPVLREDGSDAIPDLVLSRTMETAENKYEHLIVELKRPSHRLTPADIDQIRSYAVAVAEDDRFQQPNVQWTYVLVGNSTSTGVDDQRAQVGQPYGRAQITARYSIWVRNGPRSSATLSTATSSSSRAWTTRRPTTPAWTTCAVSTASICLTPCCQTASRPNPGRAEPKAVRRATSRAL
jgi:hypothetical protein